MFGVWNRCLGLLRSLPDTRPLSAVSVQQLLLQSLCCSHDTVRKLQDCTLKHLFMISDDSFPIVNLVHLRFI